VSYRLPPFQCPVSRLFVFAIPLRTADAQSVACAGFGHGSRFKVRAGSSTRGSRGRVRGRCCPRAQGAPPCFPYGLAFWMDMTSAHLSFQPLPIPGPSRRVDRRHLLWAEECSGLLSPRHVDQVESTRLELFSLCAPVSWLRFEDAFLAHGSLCRPDWDGGADA
jgi:hypothetical protein